MRDNKTSQPAQEYYDKIEKTIPLYNYFHEQTIHLIEVTRPNPATWLDTGCGTGILASKAVKEFTNTHFVLADPSETMLSIAKEKFLTYTNLNSEYILAGTEDLNCTTACFDVITAIMSHHYFDIETRRKATANCFRMLKEGGVYVTFENIKPRSEKGLHIGLERWRRYQLSRGKSIKEVERHLNRYGIETFPISIDSHISLLHDVGFSAVEILWVSVMQAGFYAIKTTSNSNTI